MCIIVNVSHAWLCPCGTVLSYILFMEYTFMQRYVILMAEQSRIISLVGGQISARGCSYHVDVYTPAYENVTQEVVNNNKDYFLLFVAAEKIKYIQKGDGIYSDVGIAPEGISETIAISFHVVLLMFCSGIIVTHRLVLSTHECEGIKIKD